MALAVPQTPQRPLPGAYTMTPAPARQTSSSSGPQNSIFRTTSSSNLQKPAQQYGASQQTAPTQQQSSSAAGQTASNNGQQTLSPVERGARTISETLQQEMRYPELDSYMSQGISADYDMVSNQAWAPFQKVKVYQIPDKIFEQYNQAQVSTVMGLFAELNHGWIAIDNALYLWDYTHPNPELIGFEEQPNSITTVKLAKPRADVFVPSITHVLVVATTSDIFLIGLASEPGPAGSQTVSLYQTRMKVPVRGIDVSCIESSATGRIFFAGGSGADVYELTYQQEEGWFQSRCGKINHTNKGINAILPRLSLVQKRSQEYITQLVVDDSRNLLYALTSKSSIRVFHMKPDHGLALVIDRNWQTILGNVSHMSSRSELLLPNASIVSLSPIPAQEASRINLMATTITGCRIFFSATSGTYYQNNPSIAPNSMQVHHVKFPPPPSSQQKSSSQQVSSYQGGSASIDINSKQLVPTVTSRRYPSGHFLAFVQLDQQTGNDTIFVSTPDSGRIARSRDASQVTRFIEFAAWLPLNSNTQDVGLMTLPWTIQQQSQGFGNELALQFDKPATEIAVLTNTGIYTFRRRRLVDVFAAIVRHGGADEGLDGEVRKFVRLYGRGETAATALAVACGQGSDVTADSRVAKVNDPEVLEFARRTFIEFGGKPMLNENSIMDNNAPTIDNVRPSPRHEGTALYVSRLVRSIWWSPVLREQVTPSGGLTVTSVVPVQRLQEIQQDLTRVQEFLSANKSFIDGLAGPEALGRVSTKQEELALQGEHRALTSLVRLISDIIEGISFVLVLLDEQVTEIVLSLADTSRQKLRELTYEQLFCKQEGKDLARELVKAIVNRNISKGSNVETVAEALRRRCGSFCSSDDVVIFKAQEQLKKASEAGPDSATGRRLLNEALKLFQRVAASLSMDVLQQAVEQFASMSFYAGAIQLCLSVAHEQDRGNRALAWMRDGSLQTDDRRAIYESRQKCYNLIYNVIQAVDRSSSQAPEKVDGQYTANAKRKREAYDVIDGSDDEVFQMSLYDWYLSQGWNDRLLEIQSPYVITYLQRKSTDDVAHADLLWRYYALHSDYAACASVQLQLAKSGFDPSLEQRIEYLSRAKANASTRTIGITEMSTSKYSRQELLREITDLLDVASIQEDLVQRMKGDARLTDERRPEILKQLSGQILSIDELYNGYADQASYHDLCLAIYQVADYRNAADIKATWQNLLETTHHEAEQSGNVEPYEAIADKVRTMGNRLNLSGSTFPIPTLLPLLERYAFEYQRNRGPPTWVLDVFLDLNVPYETLLPVLESMFYNDEAPFQGRNRRVITQHILYVVQRWWARSSKSGKVPFGSEENAVGIVELLRMLERQGMLGDGELEDVRALKGGIEAALR